MGVASSIPASNSPQPYSSSNPVPTGGVTSGYTYGVANPDGSYTISPLAANQYIAAAGTSIGSGGTATSSGSWTCAPYSGNSSYNVCTCAGSTLCNPATVYCTPPSSGASSYSCITNAPTKSSDRTYLYIIGAIVIFLLIIFIVIGFYLASKGGKEEKLVIEKE